MTICALVHRSTLAVLLLGSAELASGQITLLHEFVGGTDDGANPQGSLTLAGSKLYGMTRGGGDADCGVAFSMNLDGSGYSVLHEFNGSTSGGPVGALPEGSLTLIGTKLYGLTQYGGPTDSGIAFSMNTDGSGYTILHNFLFDWSNGYYPDGSLTLVGNKLCGLTMDAIAYPPVLAKGMAFSMNLDGSGFGPLHWFLGGADDGQAPHGSLTLGGSKLYGMTNGGGDANLGVAFSMNSDGSDYKLIHEFAGGPNDGQCLGQSSLTFGDSKLYGITATGGQGHGVLFSMNTDGTDYTLLRNFAGGWDDAGHPTGALTLMGSKLYGMAWQTYGGDVIYSINTDGTGFTILQEFPSAWDVAPNCQLLMHDNVLYGMTLFGGDADHGVVFSVPIPEPGTIALLALGGLAMVRRRRR